MLGIRTHNSDNLRLVRSHAQSSVVRKNNMRPNKVVLILMGSNPGGIELQIPVLVSRLQKYKPLVYLIHGMRTRENCVFRGTNIIPYRGTTGLPSSAAALFRFAVKHRDLIFQVFNIGPLFLLILRLAGAKRIVYCVRGTIYGKSFLRKLFIRALWKLALSNNISIVCNSDYSAARFRRLICPKAKVKTIYNPLDMDRFYNLRTEYPCSPKRIIYAGRLAPGKNVRLWIKIANSMAKQHPEMEFHIYGGGPLLQDLELYAETLAIRERLTFHGHTPKIQEAYKAADLMVFLSEYESFGNVVVEGILSGVPVLCSDIPSLREIFSDYPHVLIPLDGNEDSNITGKVDKYPDLVKIAVKAQQDFIRLFSAEAHVRQLEAVYRGFDT